MDFDGCAVVGKTIADVWQEPHAIFTTVILPFTH